MPTSQLIALASLRDISQTTHATVLFTDNFTAPNGFDGAPHVNIDLAGGRLGRTRASSLITLEMDASLTSNAGGNLTNCVNGSNSDSIVLGPLNASKLQLGWSNAEDRFIGIENLSIETVREPTSAAFIFAGIGVEALRRRSCCT